MLALCFGVSGTASADNDAFHYNYSALPSQSSWMSTLDDQTPLNHLSIPGTHASAGRVQHLPYQSQTLTLRQQLDAGVRFLDFAVREQGNDVFVYHAGRAQMPLVERTTKLLRS
jgi:1-phosphatidylinositol phosphodiesterase